MRACVTVRLSSFATSMGPANTRGHVLAHTKQVACVSHVAAWSVPHMVHISAASCQVALLMSAVSVPRMDAAWDAAERALEELLTAELCGIDII